MEKTSPRGREHEKPWCLGDEKSSLRILDPPVIKRGNGNPPIITGWWYTYPSEKYEFVSWDDEIPNIWENKSHVPNHQPDKYYKWFTQLETSKKDVRLPRLIMKELIIIQDYKVVPPQL